MDKNIIYVLPDDGDPSVWGSKYWGSFNDLASQIPCGECSSETNSFLSFYHDYVNKKIGKQTFDQKNYDEWVEKINKQANIMENKQANIMENKKMSDNVSGLLALFIIGTVLVVGYFAIIKKR